MGTGLLVKLDLFLLFFSFVGILSMSFLKSKEHIKFKNLQRESRDVFRGFKSKIMTLLERTEKVEETSLEEEEEIKVTPDDHVEIQKILRKVEMLLSGNDYEQAEKLLVEALAFNPNDEDVNTLLGFVYMKRKKYTKAESIYIHLVEMKVQDPSIYANLGKVLEAQENYDPAVKSFKEAIKRDPHNSARYAQLGALLWKMKNIGEAIDAYEQAVRFDTRNTLYLFALGELYLSTDAHSLATKVFERILDIEPYNEKAKIHYLDLKEKGYVH